MTDQEMQAEIERELEQPRPGLLVCWIIFLAFFGLWCASQGVQ
jgi:hypothetical protein